MTARVRNYIKPKEYHEEIIAAILMMTTGYAMAGIPPGMPATASAMTPRDNCFQRLRGHIDASSLESGYQVNIAMGVEPEQAAG